MFCVLWCVDRDCSIVQTCSSRSRILTWFDFRGFYPPCDAAFVRWCAIPHYSVSLSLFLLSCGKSSCVLCAMSHSLDNSFLPIRSADPLFLSQHLLQYSLGRFSLYCSMRGSYPCSIWCASLYGVRSSAKKNGGGSATKRSCQKNNLETFRVFTDCRSVFSWIVHGALSVYCPCVPQFVILVVRQSCS